MAKSTASKIYCPNCGTRTHAYCHSYRKANAKVRYRKCRKCDTRVKTIQYLDDIESGEHVVPNPTPEESNKNRSVAMSKHQKGRREAIKQIKLTERDVAEIKYLIHNGIQTQVYTAMQYGVEKTAIHRIATGACFADIPTPKSLADL